MMGCYMGTVILFWDPRNLLRAAMCVGPESLAASGLATMKPAGTNGRCQGVRMRADNPIGKTRQNISYADWNLKVDASMLQLVHGDSGTKLSRKRKERGEKGLNILVRLPGLLSAEIGRGWDNITPS